MGPGTATDTEPVVVEKILATVLALEKKRPASGWN
jgi:hypothetical protein